MGNFDEEGEQEETTKIKATIHSPSPSSNQGTEHRHRSVVHTIAAMENKHRLS
ncbi:hypothetical protein PHLCEN_2v9863 [Hermanssonia centrifuga]|uniref:Uncharacterized protein n=1 Tax=Hermanssonia centrifuga TaxID=98765 RepID=A0A2R6NPN4_9APHY|nr:hypothetical protein PHLCEN_2v9863 [Hermanssonia centrifuga]